MSLLIIGAGISGLQAGNVLLEQGFEQFRIVEARSDIGGRIQNLESSFTDVPLPLGSITPFTDQAFFDKIPFNPQTTAFCTFASGCVDGGFNFDDFGFNYRGATLKDYLDQTLLPPVSNKLDLNTAVTAIDYTDPNKISVQTNTGTVYEADRVLLATPPTTLRDKKIQFNPPLPPSYQRAADSTEITGGFRVWFEFSNKFYADVVFIEDIEAELRNAVLGQNSNKNILTYQENAGELDNLSSQQVEQRLLDGLDRIYNGAASASLIKSRVQNWNEEEFINCVLADIDDTGTLATPIDGRIFITGEYVNGDFGEEIAAQLADSSPPNPSDVVVINGGPVPSPVVSPTQAPQVGAPDGEEEDPEAPEESEEPEEEESEEEQDPQDGDGEEDEDPEEEDEEGELADEEEDPEEDMEEEEDEDGDDEEDEGDEEEEGDEEGGDEEEEEDGEDEEDDTEVDPEEDEDPEAEEDELVDDEEGEPEDDMEEEDQEGDDEEEEGDEEEEEEEEPEEEDLDSSSECGANSKTFFRFRRPNGRIAKRDCSFLAEGNRADRFCNGTDERHQQPIFLSCPEECDCESRQ